MIGESRWDLVRLRVWHPDKNPGDIEAVAWMLSVRGNCLPGGGDDL